MYNYSFKENNESVIKEVTNVNIEIDKNYYLVNFILTEKNILVFHDINRGKLPYGRGVQSLPELYLLFSIPINEINYFVENDNLYINLNGKKINCYKFDLENFLK